MITCQRRPVRRQHRAVPEPTWLPLISEREREVLHCVAQGMSNAEIAAALFISTATVKTHISRLLEKTRSADRLKLAVAAWSSGLVRATG